MTEGTGFLDSLSRRIDTALESRTSSGLTGPEVEYLRRPAPNICEWVTGLDYWNVPTTFDHTRQYQIMRDLFGVRCPICNSMKPEAVDCWGKSRMYLESEVLLCWVESETDFVCPRCGSTQRELLHDGILQAYNETIILAGMRSGKSYLGAHIGGYFENFISSRAMFGQGHLQRMLRQEKSEWFEVTFSASTATQAQQTIYAKYREMRKNSPWIQRYSSWVQAFESQQPSEVDRWMYNTNADAILDGWARVRYNRIASDSAGVAGKTRIMASIDEWARLADTEGSRSAKELYRVLNQSLATVRAAVMQNELPSFLGMMLNVTSPISQDDPAMEHYNKAAEGILPRTYYWKGATWDFNPQMPRHVFDDDYVKDAMGAERDFGANPPNAESPYVDDPKRFWKSIDFDRDPIARFRPSFFEDTTGKKYIGMEVEECKLNHVNPYYLFGDAGLNWDSFGLVCAHSEWLNVDDFESDETGPDGEPLIRARAPVGRGRMEPVDEYGVVFSEDLGTFLGANMPVGADGDMIMEAQKNRRRMANYFTASNKAGARPFDHMNEMLCTVIDFSVRIVPTRERDIWFNSVVNIIAEVQKKVRIAGVAFDHWNAESTIQQLRTMGIITTKVQLGPVHFMNFLRMTYNGRVKLLPPHAEDTVGITDTGALVIATPQEQMQGQSVALVELLKLTRSPDLKKFFNPKKGTVRGRDSDDLARCYVGVHHLIQDSIVDSQANMKRKMNIRKRIAATDTTAIGTVATGRGNW